MKPVEVGQEHARACLYPMSMSMINVLHTLARAFGSDARALLVATPPHTHLPWIYHQQAMAASGSLRSFSSRAARQAIPASFSPTTTFFPGHTHMSSSLGGIESTRADGSVGSVVMVFRQATEAGGWWVGGGRGVGHTGSTWKPLQAGLRWCEDHLDIISAIPVSACGIIDNNNLTYMLSKPSTHMLCMA